MLVVARGRAREDAGSYLDQRQRAPCSRVMFHSQMLHFSPCSAPAPWILQRLARHRVLPSGSKPRRPTAGRISPRQSGNGQADPCDPAACRTCPGLLKYATPRNPGFLATSPPQRRIPSAPDMTRDDGAKASERPSTAHGPRRFPRGAASRVSRRTSNVTAGRDRPPWNTFAFCQRLNPRRCVPGQPTGRGTEGDLPRGRKWRRGFLLG